MLILPLKYQPTFHSRSKYYDHFLYPHELKLWCRGDIVGRVWMLVTLLGVKGCRWTGSPNKKSAMVNKGFGKPHEYSRLQFSILWILNCYISTLSGGVIGGLISVSFINFCVEVLF